MRIGVVITSLQMGGLEKSISTLSNFLSEQHEIEIVAFTLYKFKHFYKLNNNINLIEPDFDKIGSNKLIYYFKIFFHFRKCFKREKLDIILTFHEYCNFQVILASIGTKIPIVISERASPDLKITFPTNVFRKILYPLADGVIAQTNKAKEKFSKNFGDKQIVRVIPNAIDLSILEATNTVKVRENKIVWVGRFHPVKGLDYLIEAFRKIAMETDWNLVLVGDGPLYNHFKQLSFQMNLASRIEFVGKTTNVYAYLLQSDIFALTSLSEGYPNALCEAMAAGCACVSFDCSAGPSDIINHYENGFLVDYLSTDDLYEKLMILINDNALRTKFQTNAIQIRDRLSLDQIGLQYLDFLNSIKVSASTNSKS